MQEVNKLGVTAQNMSALVCGREVILNFILTKLGEGTTLIEFWFSKHQV